MGIEMGIKTAHVDVEGCPDDEDFSSTRVELCINRPFLARYSFSTFVDAEGCISDEDLPSPRSELYNDCLCSVEFSSSTLADIANIEDCETRESTLFLLYRRRNDLISLKASSSSSVDVEGTPTEGYSLLLRLDRSSSEPSSGNFVLRSSFCYAIETDRCWTLDQIMRFQY